MRKISRDAVLIACVVVFAVTYLWADSLLPASSLGDPLGPRVFPALVGSGLLLSAVLMVVELVAKSRAPAKAPEAPVEDDAQDSPTSRKSGWTLAGVALWTALYYVTLDHVGYLIGTLVFLGGLLSFFNRRRYWLNAIVAIAFTLIVDALFTYALGTPMAEGWLSI
jgi:putative tricarboxylic transport membrane protein